MSDPADVLASLRHALGSFAAVLRNRPAPDLHAVIVQAPKNDHPRLYPGAKLPPLPVSLRGKTWLDAFFIPLVPASKIHYFGDADRLGAFRDLSRVALAALRTAFPDVDSLAGRVLYAGPAGDADHILADFSLLALRDIAALSPSRRFVMERWHWTGEADKLRVPYYEDERKAVGLPGPLPPETAEAPDVTTFTADVFSFSATALDFAIGLVPVAPTVVPTEPTSYEPRVTGPSLSAAGTKAPAGKSPDKPEPEILARTPLTLDDRAVAVLTRWIIENRRKISKRQIAKDLGCHHSSLDNCPTFQRVWKLNQDELKRGYRNAKTGNIETDDDD